MKGNLYLFSLSLYNLWLSSKVCNSSYNLYSSSSSLSIFYFNWSISSSDLFFFFLFSASAASNNSLCVYWRASILPFVISIPSNYVLYIKKLALDFSIVWISSGTLNNPFNSNSILTFYTGLTMFSKKATNLAFSLSCCYFDYSYEAIFLQKINGKFKFDFTFI